MSTQARTFPKAFAVWFKDLERWDIGFFRKVGWHWDKQHIWPIGRAIARKVAAVEKVDDITDLPIIEKISFGGLIKVTEVEQRKGYKGRLFWADAGDFIYSKIRAKQGSLAVVPPSIERLAVSAEYPVYLINWDVCDPDYLTLVLKSKPFLNLLSGLSHGGLSKTRIPPETFESLEIPLPPLPVQRAIVARWHRAQDEYERSEERIKELEGKIPSLIYELLGTPPPEPNAKNQKLMVLMWKDLDRWSFNYLHRAARGLLGFANSIHPIVPLSECLAETMNGYSIKPVLGPTPHKMLKLNALASSGLQTEASKFVKVSDKVAEKFSLHTGDLLMCRSVGSYDHIAKCAVVERDEPNILFPDIIIRVRLTGKADPKYVREVIQTPLGRSYFQSNARTAVGMWKIGAEDINNFPLPLPPLETQREIVRRVEEGRTEIAREREAATRRARESEAEVEALILGAKKIETAL